jgi:hypothetical protein
MVDSSLNWVFNFATGYFSNASVTTFPHPTASNNKYVWYVYGLDTNSAHRMPFNRVDYYLDSVAGDAPSSCASNTYTLYRSTVSQDNGGLSKSPLIDCVRNFQVAFGLGTNLDGTVNSWVNTLPSTMSASDILAQVRAVKIFLLVQEGAGDTSKSPGFRFSGTLTLGDQNIQLATGWTPTGTDLQYQWKVIQMAVKPMNLR